MIESFPLYWPPAWHRTQNPERAMFKVSRAHAVNELLNGLHLMGAKDVIISSNVSTYLRGGIEIPYADQKVKDTGVAVYFTYEGSQCIPCDRWDRVRDNIRAVGLTIEALRGLERWGAKEMMQAAFKGFIAIPEKTSGVDHFQGLETRPAVVARYRALAKELHPDQGGTNTEFTELQSQYKVKLQTVDGA